MEPAAQQASEEEAVTQRVLACVNSIARTNFSLGPGEDISLEAFQLDSLSLFAFLVEVEKSFGIDFDEALLNIDNLPTIRTTAAFIVSKL
jgi:acyl carrier protein